MENCKSRSEATSTIMKILGYTSIGKYACDIDFDKSNLSKIIRNEKDIISFIQADKIIYQIYQIDDELFDDKLNQLNNDIKLKEIEFDKYSVLAKNDADIMKNLEEFRKSINTLESLQLFDRTVWDSVIDECIMGDLDADGNDDPYKITFIYKTGDKGYGNGLNFKSPRKKTKENCVPKNDTMSSLETNDACRMCSIFIYKE